MDIAPLTTQDFTRGLITDVSPSLLQYYWEHRWPRDLFLLIEKVSVKVNTVIYEVWNDPEDAEESARFRILARCFSEKYVLELKSKPTQLGPVVRVGLTGDVLKALEVAVNAHEQKLKLVAVPDVPDEYKLVVPDREASLKPRTAGDDCDLPPRRQANGSGADSSEPRQRIKIPSVRSVPQTFVDPRMRIDENEPTAQEATITLRSADSALRYLGAITRTQNSPCLKPTPDQTPCGAGHALFLVQTGRSERTGSFSAITYQGERFYIAATAVRSIQTMALIAQLIALNTSAKDLPTTPVVIGVQ